MRSSVLLFAIILASCSASPKNGFIVVDSWGTVVLHTHDEVEAWRLSKKLTLMGRVFASKPQYFVIKRSD